MKYLLVKYIVFGQLYGVTQYAFAYKDKNLFLLAASALCEISLEISPECCLVFAQCVFQGFLTARFALEDQCKFLG